MEAQYNLQQWVSYTLWISAAASAVEEAKVVASATASAPSAAPTTSSAPGGTFACIRNAESGGNYTAVNAGSGAGGAYQFMPSTWQALGGSGLPEDAPPAVQDAMAQKLYAEEGWSPWVGDPCVG